MPRAWGTLVELTCQIPPISESLVLLAWNYSTEIARSLDKHLETSQYGAVRRKTIPVQEISPSTIFIASDTHIEAAEFTTENGDTNLDLR